MHKKQYNRSEPTDFLVAVEFSGIINGQPLNSVGEVTIDEGEGLSSGHFDVEVAPDEIDFPAYGAMLFTGYPNACKTMDGGAANPFYGGNYYYRRNYHFVSSKTDMISLRMRCRRVSLHRLAASFHVSGTMPHMANCTGVSSISETWNWDRNDCAINGQFKVTWLDQCQGSIAHAIADSVYYPDTKSLPAHQPVVRNLTLTTQRIGTSRFAVSQTSALVPFESSAHD